ncbi:hypothetical protein [Raoultella ornithinolytica]|uniref:hypothetical protein n=1 Tax=Raoultella ornithinolytica TaxID=54291 RepID=UPI001F290176|nr:hypothetical protein [Raoultella ornithinolytica]
MSSANQYPSLLRFCSFCGFQQFARFLGGVLITEDGESIEGNALADVELIGVVMHIISKPGFDDCPVM